MTKAEIKYLTLKEWKAVSRLPKAARDSLILELLYKTGCTVNELVNLKVADIDFRKKTATFRARSSRNHEQRVAILPTTLTLEIKEFLRTKGKFQAKQSYIFDTRQSPQMTTKRIRQIVQDCTKKAGIKGKNNPQILRYTHIVHAYMRNIPIASIQRQVGLKRSRAIQIFTELKTETYENDYRKFLR